MCKWERSLYWFGYMVCRIGCLSINFCVGCSPLEFVTRSTYQYLSRPKHRKDISIWNLRSSALSSHRFSTLSENLYSLGQIEKILFPFFIHTITSVTFLEVMKFFLGVKNSVVQRDTKVWKVNTWEIIFCIKEHSITIANISAKTEIQAEIWHLHSSFTNKICG